MFAKINTSNYYEICGRPKHQLPLIILLTSVYLSNCKINYRGEPAAPWRFVLLLFK